MVVKAAVLVEPRKIEIMEFPKPEPDENSILAATDVCGICGTDVHIFEGRMKIPYPIILGHEFTVIAKEVGANASGFEALGREIREGDRLAVVPGTSKFCGMCFFCKFVPERPPLCINRRAFGINLSSKDPPHLFGAFSEMMYIDPTKWYVFRLDDDFPNELGALIEPMAVASRALERAFSPGKPYAWDGFGPGKCVVVQGAGPIGLLAVAAAKIAGAGEIIVIEKIETRIKMAEEIGADHVIDMNVFAKEDERINEVLRLTAGIGSDVAIECVGLPQAFAEGTRMVRRGGKYIEVGHYTDTGAVEFRPHIICRGDIDVLGSWSYSHIQFRTSIDLLSRYADTIPFRKMITHTFHFSEATRAIQTIKQGEAVKVTLAS